MKILKTLPLSSKSKQHSILEALYHKEKSQPDHWKSGSKGLDKSTFNENFQFKVTPLIIDVLKANGYIQSGEDTFETSKKTYYLTDLGRIAFLNNNLLQNVWYRSRDFWIAIIALIVAIFIK